MKTFGSGVTDAQRALARKFEQHGITSYSQAIKAFQNRDNARIQAWKQALSEKLSQHN